jgi:TrmH family RNA methyltransferase
MANFDFKNLILINPCKLDDECYARAMHAGYILDEAKIFSSFDEAVKDIDYLVATSSIESLNDKRHLRNAIWLEDISKKLFEMDGRVGLVFGREDYGLYNEEIAVCDTLLRIPTSDSYQSLNLSHAVGIVLYSLYLNKDIEQREIITLSNIEKEKLFNFFSDILKEINYPEHKKENTEIMFKRIMGRAMPSKWEFHTLMGVFSKSLENIKKNKK